MIEFGRETWASIPTWLQVLPLLLAGWLAALVGRLVISWLLSILRLDQAAESSGVNEFLRKGQVTYTPSRLVGLVCFWLILAAVFTKAGRMLDVGLANAMSARFEAFMPGVLVAGMLATLGVAVVFFLANVVVTIARNAGFAHGDTIGRAMRWIGIIFVSIVAFEEAGVGRTLLSPLALIIVAAVAFGFALAFGIGCKDLARDLLTRLVSNLRERRRVTGKRDLEDA